MGTQAILEGTRFELTADDAMFPEALRRIPIPPEKLYIIGSVDALSTEGVAIVGARKATPYGKECAAKFATMLAVRDIALVTGSARGCDAAALRSCVEHGGRAAVFLGGGCDVVYPSENAGLFQQVVEKGGVIVSEHAWDVPPQPFMFRARNRLTAGQSKAVLIIEAGLPSGTFSTADDALESCKEVFAVPGPINSPASRGANRLIYQGATPIVDEDTFANQLHALFGKNALSEQS